MKKFSLSGKHTKNTCFFTKHCCFEHQPFDTKAESSVQKELRTELIGVSPVVIIILICQNYAGTMKYVVIPMHNHHIRTS